ncbi:unnamed protein product [Mytilus coruscus]|uniref:Uncharacterized protein n=1 Tax=Mytilus coruscus TaxID=42192 RepID=A0A6J8E2C4_MYTCO|nr:unnamed protein product [Mytilus coruscus]
MEINLAGFLFKADINKMAESAIANESLALYGFMCQNIVGREEHVKNFRMMNSVRDNLSSDKCWTTITSGSLGEGLDMKDSDLDIMLIMKCFEAMVTEDTKPGYTQLRLVHGFPHSSYEKIGEKEVDVRGLPVVKVNTFKVINKNGRRLCNNTLILEKGIHKWEALKLKVDEHYTPEL